MTCAVLRTASPHNNVGFLVALAFLPQATADPNNGMRAGYKSIGKPRVVTVPFLRPLTALELIEWESTRGKFDDCQAFRLYSVGS